MSPGIELHQQLTPLAHRATLVDVNTTHHQPENSSARHMPCYWNNHSISLGYTYHTMSLSAYYCHSPSLHHCISTCWCVRYELWRHHSYISTSMLDTTAQNAKLHTHISNGMLKLHCHVSSRMLRLLRLKDWIFSPLHISEPPFPELTD